MQDFLTCHLDFLALLVLNLDCPRGLIRLESVARSQQIAAAALRAEVFNRINPRGQSGLVPEVPENQDGS